MPTFILNKLVRDKLLAEYERLGQQARYKKLSKEEHLQALKQKIIEEAQEIPLDTGIDRLAAEIADVQQALADLKTLSGVSDEQVTAEQSAKLARKGGFLAGSFVESLVLGDDDEWAAYYRRQPDVFLEVKEDLVLPSIEQGTYRHYKGGSYEVLGIGRHSEVEEYFVIYRPLYEHDGQPDIWLRPYAMFVGEVIIDGEPRARFEKVTDDER